jgi:predicted HNH restriction endonuclease
MAAWIFQGNPKTFDIDGYLEQCTSSILWLVRQQAKAIAVGDVVFLWRAEGDGKIPGGVIAELEVVEPVRSQLDDPESVKFWIAKDDADADSLPSPSLSAPRVRLRLIRLASKKEVLKRKWLQEDAVLKDLGILRMAQQTNYAVTSAEYTRLRALWDNTGNDWTRADSIAALYIYDQLFGNPISKVPDSPVSVMAQKIGRATSGMYNKLMNFRSLDPRMVQKGFEGSSSVDKAVWKEFYDSVTDVMRSAELGAEYARLWAETEVPPLADTSRAAFAEEVERLESRSLEELVAGFNSTRGASGKPARRSGTVAAFKRDPRVSAITRKRADFRCEVPSCGNHQFIGASGESYVETHHLKMLADGGDDVPENTVAVCPNHHRELHHGKQRDSLTNQLLELRQKDATLTLQSASIP